MPSRAHHTARSRALIGLALGLAAGPALAQTVSTQAALNHMGETVTICGKIASANFAGGQSMILAFDYPYPGQPFSALILPADRAKFNAPEMTLLGKRMCISGTIQNASGRPQMILRDPKQLAAAR
jgi:hypothetical protein